MSRCGFAYALGVVGADCPLLAACSCQALAGSLEVMTLCLKGGHVPPKLCLYIPPLALPVCPLTLSVCVPLPVVSPHPSGMSPDPAIVFPNPAIAFPDPASASPCPCDTFLCRPFPCRWSSAGGS